MADAASGVIAVDQRGAMITTRRGADILAFLLMCLFTTGSVALSLMPVVTNELRTVIGLSDAQIGLLSSVFVGCVGASALLSGIAAARWGGRLLGVSATCFAVGSLVFGLSSGFAGFVVGRALQGIGGGMVTATCSPLMARVLPPERLGRAWGIAGCGGGLGTMAALLIMPSIESAGGYRAVFLAAAGLNVVVGIAVLSQRAVRALPGQGDGVTTLRGLVVSLGAAAINKRVLLLGLSNAASLAAMVGILAWTPSFLQDVHGSSAAISVYLVAGLGAAQLLGNPMGAAGAAAWGKYRVIIGCLAIMSVATAVLGIVPGVALAFAMVLLVGFVSMFLFPPSVSYLPEIVAKPQQIGPSTGIYMSMGFVGSFVAPLLFGSILDAGGQSSRSYVIGYFMLAAFGALGVVGMAFFRGPKRKPS